MMQPLEITEIEREIDNLKAEIKATREKLQRLENQKLNTEARLIATRRRIQKSGVKY